MWPEPEGVLATEHRLNPSYGFGQQLGSQVKTTLITFDLTIPLISHHPSPHIWWMGWFTMEYKLHQSVHFSDQHIRPRYYYMPEIKYWFTVIIILYDPLISFIHFTRYIFTLSFWRKGCSRASQAISLSDGQNLFFFLRFVPDMTDQILT